MRFDNRFEGANPRRSGDIEQPAPGRVLIRPWSEDGDGNYKFCLNVKAINEGGAPERLTLQLDWDDIEYMDPRDYVLLGRGEDWQFLQGRCEGMVTTVDLEVPPGEWYLGLHPVYDLAMLEADRRRAVAAGLTERVIGKSRAGREISALSAGT